MAHIINIHTHTYMLIYNIFAGLYAYAVDFAFSLVQAYLLTLLATSYSRRTFFTSLNKFNKKNKEIFNKKKFLTVL